MEYLSCRGIDTPLLGLVAEVAVGARVWVMDSGAAVKGEGVNCAVFCAFI